MSKIVTYVFHHTSTFTSPKMGDSGHISVCDEQIGDINCMKRILFDIDFQSACGRFLTLKDV